MVLLAVIDAVRHCFQKAGSQRSRSLQFGYDSYKLTRVQEFARAD